MKVKFEKWNETTKYHLAMKIGVSIDAVGQGLPQLQRMYSGDKEQSKEKTCRMILMKIKKQFQKWVKNEARSLQQSEVNYK